MNHRIAQLADGHVLELGEEVGRAYPEDPVVFHFQRLYLHLEGRGSKGRKGREGGGEGS